MKGIRFCLAALFLALIVSPPAFALRLYSTPASDGWGCLDFWNHGDRNEYSDYGSVLRVYRYEAGTPGNWFEHESYDETPVIAMPISGLRGKVLQPGSARLWFYTSGLSNVTVGWLLGDTGGTIGYWAEGATGHPIETLTCGAGWVSVDVTSGLQSQINHGNNWAGYAFWGSFIDNRRSDGYVYASEAGHGLGPYLEVTPEPPGLLVLCAGLMSFAGVVRRRR